MAFRKETKIKSNFSKISIGLASPEEILENSSGEVTANQGRNLLVRDDVKLSTTVPTNPNVTVCSANASSVR